MSKFIKLTPYRDPNIKCSSKIKFVFVQISKIESLQWCENDSKTYLYMDNTSFQVLETPEQIIELCKA